MAPEMSQGLHLNMSQRMDMRMTPQMIQSMEMLQLPILALEQRIQQELLENPALELSEMREDTDEGYEENESGEETPDFDGDSTDLRRIDEVDYSWDDFYDEGPPRRAYTSPDDEEYFDPVENAASPGLSFHDYLVSQLGYQELTEREERIAARIVLYLDPSGYLPVPLEETVDPEEDPPPSGEELEMALEVVQSLDPPGVGARDVRECLRLQMDARATVPPLARMIVDSHLEDLAANRLPQLAKTLGCTLEDIKDAASFIKGLNPQPGLEYGPVSARHVQPDVIAEVDDDGHWDVRLANGAQPEISDIFLALYDTTKRGRQLREQFEKDPERAPQFRQMLAVSKNGEQGKHLREKYQSARWLVTAIQQRERTLLRVAIEIVEAQKPFLSGQTDAPSPLMMQEIADKVEVDISTVSRAVKEKYMDTPRGVLPLRMLFTHAVGGSRGGKEQSNAHIKNCVREIIENEDKKKPLKDDEIQALLAKDGMHIKRRTVQKYRADLGYPSHSQRREY